MSAPKHFRLALLVCDTPLHTVVAAHGDYTPIFDALLRASVPQGVTYELKPYDVVRAMEYPPQDADMDGVLLTGSAASAYEPIEWIDKLVAYTGRLVRERPTVKVFGICFGHQIIARALGGECIPNEGKWEVGVTPIELSPLGERLLGAHNLNIHQMHRDHVPHVPAPLHLLGSTSVAHNQGMVLLRDGVLPEAAGPTDVHVFTVQGHPEFTAGISDLVVDARASTGVLSKEIAADAHSRNAELRNDGVDVVGRLIWKVLGV